MAQPLDLCFLSLPSSKIAFLEKLILADCRTSRSCARGSGSCQFNVNRQGSRIAVISAGNDSAPFSRTFCSPFREAAAIEIEHRIIIGNDT